MEKIRNSGCVLPSGKITSPRPVNVYFREKCFQLLDAARNKNLVWVSGPAGAGKSTLVSHYLMRRKIPIIWYQLDESDCDPAAFFHYLGLASHNANRGKPIGFPSLTTEYLQGLSTFITRFFEILFGHFKTPPAIVLDNYQTISPAAPIHGIITQAAAQAPRGVNFFILSRETSPRDFSRLKVNRLMTSLDWEDLRFSVEEIRGLLRHYDWRDDQEETVKLLWQKTEGWAAGLVVILESARNKDLSTEAVDEITGEELFDYFLAETFDQNENRTKVFLLKTSLLPFITPLMAEELTGEEDAGRILSELSRKHFFTFKSATLEGAYQYHSLFRDFLLSRLGLWFDRALISALKEKAAMVLEKSGYFSEAWELFAEASKWDQAVRLIISLAPSLITEGRIQTLLNRLTGIPEEYCRDYPALEYFKGVCLFSINLSGFLGCLTKAFQGFSEKDDLPGMLRTFAAAVGGIFYRRDDFSRMDYWVKWLDRTIGTDMSRVPPDVEPMVVSAMVMAISFRLPDHPEADKWMDYARRLVESPLPLPQRLQIAQSLHLCHIYMGSHDKASYIINLLEQVIDFESLPPVAQIQWCAIQEVHHHMVTASPEKCLAGMKAGYKVSRRTGVRIMDVLLLTIGAYGSIMKEDWAELDRIVEQIKPLLSQAGYFDIANYNCMLLNRDLIVEDYPSALRHGSIVFQITMKTKARIPILLARIGIAHALFELGKTREAIQHLDRIKDIAAGIPHFHWDVMVLFLETHMALSQGDEQPGLEKLRLFFDTLRKNGYCNFLYWRPAVMSNLCARALEAGVETDYVLNLIKKRNLKPIGPAVTMETWPYPVKILTLGGFDIISQDLPDSFFGKSKQKQLALLKAIIAFGGVRVPVYQLSDVLWPDSEGDAARRAFDTTLHRLRSLLGQADCIRLKEGLIALNSRFCWTDAAAFLSLSEEMEALAAQQSPGGMETGVFDELISIGDKAVRLYRGPFLPADIHQAWTLSFREKLRRKFIRMVTRSGELCMERGLWQEALERFWNGLYIDDLVEAFYQDIMICLINMGSYAEAESVFGHCRSVLFKKLGVEPSAETLAIEQSIKKIKK